MKHPLVVNTFGPEERQAVIDVLDSGQFTMGAKVRAFEEAFAAYIGTKYAVMVNSGSSANLLMVAAYTHRYGPGDVIVPAIAWSTTYSPFQQYGWRLRFVDVDDTLNADPDAVNDAAKSCVRPLLLACHLLGNPCDLDRWPNEALLEDNCESLGAEYLGRKAGAFGLMASHSFFFSHHLCTMEGGMITTDDQMCYDLLLSLRSHGWTRHLAPDNSLGVTPGTFDFILPGYNVRPLELQGAIGLVQLGKLPAMLAQRRVNAATCPLPLPRSVGTPSWFGFATPRTADLEATCETRPVVAGNFLRHPAIQHYRYIVEGNLSMAETVHKAWCYIGNHPTPIDWTAMLGKAAAA